MSFRERFRSPDSGFLLLSICCSDLKLLSAECDNFKLLLITDLYSKKPEAQLRLKHLIITGA